MEHLPRTPAGDPKSEVKHGVEAQHKKRTELYSHVIREILNDLENIKFPEQEISCPLCFRSLQRYGKKLGSNLVLLQRFVCPDCRTAGRKYNYFLDIKAMSGFRLE